MIIIIVISIDIITVVRGNGYVHEIYCWLHSAQGEYQKIYRVCYWHDVYVCVFVCSLSVYCSLYVRYQYKSPSYKNFQCHHFLQLYF